MQQCDASLQKDFENDLKLHKDRVITELGPEYPYDNDSKEIMYQYETLKNTLLEDKYWNLFSDMKNMKIIKFQQIFTSIFYIFLGLTKEEINIKDTI